MRMQAVICVHVLYKNLKLYWKLKNKKYNNKFGISVFFFFGFTEFNKFLIVVVFVFF